MARLRKPFAQQQEGRRRQRPDTLVRSPVPAGPVFGAADHYPEAIRLAEELLELRRRLQGADHWEAVSARLEDGKEVKLTDLKKGQRFRVTTKAGDIETATKVEVLKGKPKK